MSFKVVFLFFVTLCFSVPLLAVEPTPSPQPTSDILDLTLEGSIEQAIRSASSVLKAEFNTHSAGAALLQAYGQFLPNVTSTGNYNYTTGSTYYATASPTYVSGTSRNAGFNISSDLNIFNGLSDFSNLKSSLLKADAANLTVVRAKQQIDLDITQSFLQVVLDNQLVAIAKKNFQASQERENLLTEQTRVGAKSLSDLFRQQAQTSLDESFLISSKNKVLTDQLALLRKLRLDVIRGYRFIEPKMAETQLESRFQNEPDLIIRALKNRVDLKASEDLSHAGRFDVRAAWSGYLPKVDLVGGLSSVSHYLDNQTLNGASVVPPVQSNLGYQLGNQIQYFATLNLTWSLFDRFLTHENTTKAQVIADNAEIDYQDRLNQVKADVKKAYGDYKTALEQLNSSKKGLEAAEKAYEVMQGRYQVGSVSFLDLITAQTILVQAQSARAQALITFQLQEKSLKFATGELGVES